MYTFGFYTNTKKIVWLDVFIKNNGAKVNWKNTQVLTLYGFGWEAKNNLEKKGSIVWAGSNFLLTL